MYENKVQMAETSLPGADYRKADSSLRNQSNRTLQLCSIYKNYQQFLCRALVSYKTISMKSMKCTPCELYHDTHYTTTSHILSTKLLMVIVYPCYTQTTWVISKSVAKQLYWEKLTATKVQYC